jgi:hypothetical protein
MTDFRFPHEAPQKRMFIHPLRRDGKFPVSFVFPLSGRCIKRLLSPDQLEAERAKGYLVIIVP